MKHTNIQLNQAFTVVKPTSDTATQITFHRILSGGAIAEFVLSCKRRPAGRPTHARPSHVVIMMDVSNPVTSDHNPLAQALYHSIRFVSLLCCNDTVLLSLISERTLSGIGPRTSCIRLLHNSLSQPLECAAGCIEIVLIVKKDSPTAVECFKREKGWKFAPVCIIEMC
jgi:hypothetical protein